MTAMKTEQGITDFLSGLVVFLSQGHLRTNDVCGRIGSVSNDPGGLVSMRLRTSIPGLSAVTLARYPDSDVPYLLEMELVEEGRPTLAELTTLLGEYHRSLIRDGLPSEVIFYPFSEDKPWQVGVIAQLESSSPPSASARVNRISLRRDRSACSHMERPPA
jgi:hypothetical protein